MVQLIVGNKGKGKTKFLLDRTVFYGVRGVKPVMIRNKLRFNFYDIY